MLESLIVVELSDSDTEELLRRADSGDDSAVGRLLIRHRGRLRQMVAVRMDPRLSRRVDPSDVVQEALLTASRKLDDYLRTRPVPFYPWLRQIAWEQLLQMHDHHLKAEKRSVRREATRLAMSDESVMHLADQLIARTVSPSKQVVKRESRRRVRDVLNRMRSADREVLVLRFLEQLSTREISAVLDISVGAVRTRQLRALERMKRLLTGH